ncbi:MAG: homoserine kinase [Burkholderia sp.]|nr:homoserine kinase [Burkholderia sp.]
MAVFTAISNSDLRKWMRSYILGDILEFRGVPSGTENSNFFLTTTCGEYILTIFENLVAEQLPFYLNLMRYLVEHGIPVPDPISRNDGTLFGKLYGKPATVVTKLAGEVVLAPKAIHCAKVGKMLAKMHLSGRGYKGKQPNLRSLSWWQQNVPKILSFVCKEKRTLLKSELAYQIRFFKSDNYAVLPSGPCHCDLFRDNVLFTTESRDSSNLLQLRGFLDFYFAGCDKWLFDVAVTVNDWCVNIATGELDHIRAKSLLHAYQMVRPFTFEERLHWNNMLRAGAYRFWVSRLYNFYLPRPSEMLKPHDPSHFEHILRKRIVHPITLR